MTKDGQSVLAIIPARGGSRGIPKKNIVPLGGKPLIAWTIEAALAVRAIDRIVVSSDSDEILDIALRWGAQPLKRPLELSGDSIESRPVIRHALAALAKDMAPDIIVLLQPTSPLRTADDIVQALDLFCASAADGVISVYRADSKLLKSFLVREDGYLKGLTDEMFSFMDRRVLPPVYMPNGAIYLFRRSFLNRATSLFSDRMLPFEMPVERSIDIDTPADLETAERSLSLNR